MNDDDDGDEDLQPLDTPLEKDLVADPFEEELKEIEGLDSDHEADFIIIGNNYSYTNENIYSTRPD